MPKKHQTENTHNRGQKKPVKQMRNVEMGAQKKSPHEHAAVINPDHKGI